MNFNSLVFLIYLPIVVGVYWLLPFKGRKYWLLAASYFFYGYWNPAFLFLLLFSTAVDYFCSKGMDENRDKPGLMKLLLAISVVMNLGLLFTFKYADFFGETINQLCEMASIPYRVQKLGLILPVGISFYTFQTMSYTIDVYRGDFHAEKDPITFALYVTYFPQLVAGPIESPQNLLPQLEKEHFWNKEDFLAGLRILACGFFFKCVIADHCGIHVNAVFSNVDNSNALAIFIAGVLFTFQMYCDFAGYSIIATGCARMMGVRLMRNFNQPYLSQSYTEYSRRWHISLNKWFTNYLYIPLGGSRKGTFRKYLNIMIVYILSGLWHGARWTYVLWGLYAGVCICLEGALDIPKRLATHWNTPARRLFRILIMFVIYVPGSLLFRATDLDQAFALFTRLVTQIGFSADYVQSAFNSLNFNLVSLLQIILSFVVMVKLDRLTQHDLTLSAESTSSFQRTTGYAYMILLIALGWLALLATDAVAGFAYFQF